MPPCPIARVPLDDYRTPGVRERRKQSDRQCHRWWCFLICLRGAKIHRAANAELAAGTRRTSNPALGGGIGTYGRNGNERCSLFVYRMSYWRRNLDLLAETGLRFVSAVRIVAEQTGMLDTESLC